ncbi:S-adenosyl-L-methionine-dependent methyltransferase [Penicillium herquei]|nr:S-adenosyl-L-methionine-dependent methyltransferase [Penicillium herquei]
MALLYIKEENEWPKLEASLSCRPHSNPTPTIKIEVNLTGVARTCLLTLIAREYDNTLPKPILGDPYAKDVLEKLSVPAIPMIDFQKRSIVLRTYQFDLWTSAFLQKNPNATVLHLACGFDSRMQRVKWGDNTRWIDIDLPEVIHLRKKTQPISLPDRDYSLLGVDVLEENWMHDLGDISGPVLVIMEGLLPYFREEDMNRLLQRICQTFPRGEMLFEGIGSAAIEFFNRSGWMNSVTDMRAKFQSSLDDPMVLEDLDPHLKLVESVPVIQASGVERLPLLNRIWMYLNSWSASARDSARLLRFGFGQENV